MSWYIFYLFTPKRLNLNNSAPFGWGKKYLDFALNSIFCPIKNKYVKKLAYVIFCILMAV